MFLYSDTRFKKVERQVISLFGSTYMTSMTSLADNLFISLIITRVPDESCIAVALLGTCCNRGLKS